MEWKFCNLKGKISKDPTSFQIDEVGNIYQKSGAVVPKACQKCKKVFKSEIKKQPKIQKVPIYECISCKKKFVAPHLALDHKIETDHKLKKTQKDKVVGEEKIVIGSLSQITKTEDDILILCSDCNGK